MVAALLSADARFCTGVVLPATAAVMVAWIAVALATDHASVGIFTVM